MLVQVTTQWEGEGKGVVTRLWLPSRRGWFVNRDVFSRLHGVRSGSGGGWSDGELDCTHFG